MKLVSFIIFLLTVVFHTPLFARNIMPSLSRIHDKVEQARLTKKRTIQELLEQAGTKKTAGTMSEFFNQLDELVWANQELFIKTLLELHKSDPAKAVTYLKDELTQAYPKEKYPLVTFSHALKHEYDEIQKSTTQLFSIISKKDAHDGPSVQHGLEKITKLKSNLESILYFVNDLL